MLQHKPYATGLMLSLGLRGPPAKFLNVTLRRIPLVGGLYDFTHRVVGLLEPNQGDIGTMCPRAHSMIISICFYEYFYLFRCA